MIEVQIDNLFVVQNQLERLGSGVENRYLLMRRLSETMHKGVRDNFRAAGRPKWLGLKYRNGKPLNDTGALRNSFSTFSDDDTALVGTDEDAPAWYVMDDTKTLKPLVFQSRTEPEFETKFDPAKSDKVFMEDVYLYGSRRRCAAGFGLWQLAHMAEKTKLTKENLEAVIVKMLRLQANGGYKLDVKPSLLVVPPELEGTARELLEADKINGTTNTFKGRLKLHVSVHL